MAFIVSFSFAQTDPVTLPIDFETGTYTNTFNDFDGGQSAVLDNPDPTGVNTSAKVAQTIKTAVQPWAGTWMQLDGFLDFTTNNAFTMKVWSPQAGIPVLFKLDNAAGNGSERTVNTTVTEQWEELTFDFGTLDNDTYDRIVVIFNISVLGDGTYSSTYYFDDIVFFDNGGSNLNQIDLPITFEDENVDYTLTDFGNASTVLGEDPINAANTVAITNKSAAAETWAGTTMSTESGLANPIPFTATNTVVQVDVYSPAVGIPVLLKVEDKTNVDVFGQVQVNTTVANEWETMTFDFAGEIDIANTYDKMSIFFDFLNAGNDGLYYYWDNVTFIDGNNLINLFSSENISVYPNPVDDVFFVNDIENVEQISIYSVTGQEVESTRVSNNSFNVSDLATGVYTISITDENGNVFYSKMIKK